MQQAVQILTNKKVYLSDASNIIHYLDDTEVTAPQVDFQYLPEFFPIITYLDANNHQVIEASLDQNTYKTFNKIKLTFTTHKYSGFLLREYQSISFPNRDNWTAKLSYSEILTCASNYAYNPYIEEIAVYLTLIQSLVSEYLGFLEKLNKAPSKLSSYLKYMEDFFEQINTVAYKIKILEVTYQTLLEEVISLAETANTSALSYSTPEIQSFMESVELFNNAYPPSL